MNKTIQLSFSIALLFGLNSSKAQSSIRYIKSRIIGSYGYYNDIAWENELKQSNKENKIKQKTTITKDALGKPKSIVQYDTEGRLIDKKRNKKREIKVSYYKDDKEAERVYYKSNKFVKRDSSTYDKKNNLIKRLHFNSSNKLTRRERYKYDSTYITEYVFERFKKGEFSEREKTITEYYPDYSIKKSTWYKNGKPKFYNVFDCNPIGINHKVKKDSAYNCEKYEVDSLGNKIKVTIENSKGYSEKTIEYFNSKDERTALKAYDLKSNRPKYIYYFSPGTFNITKYITYKKGKELYRTENTNDNNDKCVEVKRYKKGKLKQIIKRTYNDIGLMTSVKWYNKRNKTESETKFSYEYY